MRQSDGLGMLELRDAFARRQQRANRRALAHARRRLPLGVGIGVEPVRFLQELRANAVSVTVLYPGASPEEVEESSSPPPAVTLSTGERVTLTYGQYREGVVSRFVGSIPAEVYAAAAEDDAADGRRGSESSRVFSTATTPNVIAAGSRRRPPRRRRP